MKKTCSNDELQPVDKDKSWSDLPVELWHMVFSWLPFDDQVKCRIVCKDWLDLVTSLPTFKDSNCLNLENCEISEDNEPVMTILHSKLGFKNLKGGRRIELKISPSLTTFFANLGETVTHLDIRGISRTLNAHKLLCYVPDTYRFIVENLSLFKVLHHLAVYRLSDWIQTATSTSPGEDIISGILHWVLEKTRPQMFTYDMVKSMLESPNMEIFQQNIFINRYKNLILDKVLENLNRLNDECYFGEKTGTETINVIVKQVEKAIAEADKTLDLLTRINTSVRVLSFGPDHRGNDNFGTMLKLVPNVQELHLDDLHITDKNLENLQSVASKIVSFSAQQEYFVLQMIEKLNPVNLEQLKVGLPESPAYFREKDVNRYVELLPKLKFLSSYAFALPQSHHDYITELSISPMSIRQSNLNSLVSFKNLKTVEINLFSMPDNMEHYCFFSHEPTPLKSIIKLDFLADECSFCLQCFVAFLQSLPNLRELEFESDSGKEEYADAIFDHQSNLERLRIRNKHQSKIIVFEPKINWPVMKRLKILVLHYDRVCGSGSSWRNFGKKLSKVKYLEVKAPKCVDMLKTIKSWSPSIMPALKRLRISALNSLKNQGMAFNQITKTIQFDGRKIIVDKCTIVE